MVRQKHLFVPKLAVSNPVDEFRNLNTIGFGQQERWRLFNQRHGLFLKIFRGLNRVVGAADG